MRNLIRTLTGILISMLFINAASAQTTDLTWKDVAPIFYKNCATCHRAGEIGDLYAHFTSYATTKASRFFYTIPADVKAGTMPPWKADPHYTQFLDQRILSPDNKQKIIDWVSADGPAGDTTLAPPSPVFPTGSQIGIPDLVLKMEVPYTVPGNDSDHYQCFVLPTNFTQDEAISAIEFRPGNAKVVHHVFLYLVTDSSAVQADEATPEYGYPSFGGADFDTFNVHANFLTLYGPGLTPRYFADNSIVKFPAGSFMLIQIHYAPTTVEQTDQSSVNLFFQKNISADSTRISNGHRIGEKFITEPGFYILANHIETFHEDYPVDSLTVNPQNPEAAPVSLYAIAPHMHLLGKSMKIWMTTPENDSIPLIYIPNWSFNWQMLYSFPYMIKMPPGAHIHAEATYDNTPNNPGAQAPPVNTHYGESSKDEMFKFFLEYLYYQPGDEDLVMDSCWLTRTCGYVLNDSTTTGVLPVGEIVKTPQFYAPSPNPAANSVLFTYFLPHQTTISINIYDLLGRLVQTPLLNSSVPSGYQRLSADVSNLPQGMYFCSMKVGAKTYTKQLIVQR